LYKIIYINNAKQNLLGCNKTKKLSVFVTPKDPHLKEGWLDALNIKHLDANDVICEQHFLVDSIKK